MLLLVIVSIVFGYYAKDKIGTDIIIIGTVTWDLKVLFIPFIVVYFAAVTNAVNLTDGLDGLCSSVTLLVMTFFALVSYGMGYYTLAIFCGILAGAILELLKYNSYPAQTFMGDGGSHAWRSCGSYCYDIKIRVHSSYSRRNICIRNSICNHSGYFL